MQVKNLSLPTRSFLKQQVIETLDHYWSDNPGCPANLPIEEIHDPVIHVPLVLVEIHLPEWAGDCGIDGILLVPAEACASDKKEWQSVDWFLSAFLFFECWHERLWEEKYGPIHSYSTKLKGWDTRVWDRAWANRIALFLRRWCVQKHKISEEELLGAMPQAEILVTHDVDAVRKTGAIRLKQSFFNAYNSIRFFVNGDMSNAFLYFKKTFFFFFGIKSWWTFEDLIELESNLSVRGCFNLFADERSRSFSRWLFDPKYSIRESKIEKLIRNLLDNKMLIGLHPSYDSWADGDLIRNQKRNLESVVGEKTNLCRQHWLRFAWNSTWPAQQQAGLGLDMTLMFNDRPGFRSAAALQWSPFDQKLGQKHKIQALPTVFMDSHFYDYQPMTKEQRHSSISGWIDEVCAVKGKIAILWHPHTLSDDYGWRDGFLDVLNILREAMEDEVLHS